MILRDSLIEIPLTGDGVNVKGGSAQTIRCTFSGNDSPDTDAIDYDSVVAGLVQDCRIYDFTGFNSDGIDLGENCQDCLIEGNTIFYNSDKGVSVGQGSTVTLRRNLIVGCPIGVAVKDEGSMAVVDQSTIVDCAEGVAVYEKNFGAGGGEAIVTNSIFSKCERPETVDLHSAISVAFCLSDTIALSGENNLLADPRFVDSRALNFELSAASPAIDAGDPQHEADSDGSRVDLGASYHFSQDDYPFDRTPTVVVNEILANSGEESDWIELHNRTTEEIDIGGWFLSDDQTGLLKYRIPEDTVIGAGGFVTFFEDQHFGKESLDPGRLEGFALSETGETVYLSSAVGDQLTHYRFEENFGASREGVTMGYHDKSDGSSSNFISLAGATPGAANSRPFVGPVVISEIMYHAEVEYLELLNISDEKVVFYESEKASSWMMSNGIDFFFPFSEGTGLEPGERGILTNNPSAFLAKYEPASDLKIWQWHGGKLNNGGETLQLDRPGPRNDLGTVAFVRVDRIKYDDELPWDSGAGGSGLSLNRIDESQYGNDFLNWRAMSPTPGLPALKLDYDEWAGSLGISNPNGDEDGDGLENIFEYAFDRDPLVADKSELLRFHREDFSTVVAFPVDAQRPDIKVVLQRSTDLNRWTTVPTEIIDGERQASLARVGIEFYRVRVSVIE